ncbi:hypothetical protein HYPSUDRAFT_61955 [Hypholoma sublateritium FD-334 SS-4]|uniref:Autophagy-related protein 27 n=1 Tax=Hypholoma sublateritium (strain FD-334 SS-4) TaxID=945553 RepID=A0A0D2PIN8_HYPSF|nr:hypothetical protein HYPSUDRAFT_61955 [Hypholoma sublateritium FD-334 SS-4]
MFSSPAICAILLLVCVPHGVFAQEKPCTLHDNGKYYDLNPLRSSKDYEVKTSTNQSIWLNVCQNVRTDLFGMDDSIDAGDVGGFIRRGHGDFVIGKVNTLLSIFDSRPRFVMTQGSRCKPKVGDQTTEIRASSMVEFVCDTSIYSPGSPQLLAQLPPGDDEVACAYVIEWRTRYACPTSEGGGMWGLFATLAAIFLVLLMTYTILGVLYNRFVLQLRGFDQIPQFSVESMNYHVREAWDWIKDLISTLDIGVSRGNGNGSYSAMPSSGLPTTNPVSHYSQAAGLSREEDLDTGADFRNSKFGSNANFIRPQPGRNRSAAFQSADINPISHQSKVNAAQSLSFLSPSPTGMPIEPTSQTRFSAPQNASTVPDAHGERDVMLGYDDEDAQELGDVNLANTVPTSSATSSQEASGGGESISPSNGMQLNAATAARGRDLGDGDVIRL